MLLSPNPVAVFKLTLALALLVVGGCAATPPIVTASNANGCSALIPPAWRLPVEGAALPSHDTVGEWVSFGDAQTGKLDVANGRAVDTIVIVERCEQRDRDAVASVTKRKRFLGIF